MALGRACKAQHQVASKARVDAESAPPILCLRERDGRGREPGQSEKPL